ncbi:hypothetical protein [Bradyrhizobium sp. SYSU BS000235]|uniref:hypothetical protein n=1 Tax=Bradyrhizobium sp. SYSU BS000235 TaxID=3411332 RepID=UPI003C792841
MTKMNISPLDRITMGAAELRFISNSDDGYVLARVGSGPELHETFSHDQIKQMIASGTIRIDRNWHEKGHARTRLIAGVNSLSDLSRGEAEKLMRRKYFITEFLKREQNDKNVKRTDASITVALLSIETSRTLRNARCDQTVTYKKPPSARTFRRWLSAYENGGFDALTLALVIKRSERPSGKIGNQARMHSAEHSLDVSTETRQSGGGIFVSRLGSGVLVGNDCDRSFSGFRKVHDDLQVKVERSGKRLPGNAERFSGSSDRNGGEIADVSATSARYEVVSQSGEGDHGRNLLSPTRECVERRRPGIRGIPASVRDGAWRQAAKNVRPICRRTLRMYAKNCSRRRMRMNSTFRASFSWDHHRR